MKRDSTKKIEVLLIEPPPTNRFGNLRTLGSIGTLKTDMRWPPLDLMIIAGLLRKYDIDSKIFDANSLRATLGDIKEIVEEEKPRLVIFTTSTPTFYQDLRIVDVTKQVSPDILTAVTSTHVNALPAQALELNKNLDFAVPNDSESSFIELIRADDNPENIQGISWRRNGQIFRNSPRRKGVNLDELGFPAHDLLPLEIYRDPFTRKRPITVTYASRGCINYPPCIMCSAHFYNQARYRSVEILLKEMHWMKELGIKEIRFPFESGFNELTIANDLFERMIKEKINLKFTCNGRADRLPLELLKKMKEAGCMAVNVGCESADEKVSQFMNKKVRLEQVREAVENIRKVGMDALVYFLFGLPFETKESMRKTLEFAKTLNADLVTFGIAIPHPGTSFYEYLKNKGYILTEQWDKYDPMLPPPYSYPDLSSEEIYEFARKAYRSYYLRPGFILKRFMKFNLKEEFNNFLGFVKRYVYRYG